MSYIDADLAVAVIVVWTLARDFFLAPVLVRRQLEKHAEQLAEAFFVGIGRLMANPSKRAALLVIAQEFMQGLPDAIKKMMGAGGKPPTIKEMIMLGLAAKMGLIDPSALGGPPPGGGPPQGPPIEAPQQAQKGRFQTLLGR